MRALLSHTLMTVAVVTGIVGFGLVYDGITYHTTAYLVTGIPLLTGGLWWAGRDLGRSNLAARRRRLLGPRTCSTFTVQRQSESRGPDVTSKGE